MNSVSMASRPAARARSARGPGSTLNAVEVMSRSLAEGYNGAMKATVTGATGFVGGHVARLLAERGDEVRVTYRDPERLERLEGLELKPVKAGKLARAGA